MGVKDFTELHAWKLAHELRLLVIAITDRPPTRRDFKFCDQIKDAARSATNNIAEGFGRFRHRDSAKFYRTAVASLNEVRDDLIHGHACQYVTAAELASGTTLCKRAIGAANGLIRYLMNNPDVEE
jgi:four helix bundle protein